MIDNHLNPVPSSVIGATSSWLLIVGSLTSLSSISLNICDQLHRSESEVALEFSSGTSRTTWAVSDVHWQIMVRLISTGQWWVWWGIFNDNFMVNQWFGLWIVFIFITFWESGYHTFWIMMIVDHDSPASINQPKLLVNHLVIVSSSYLQLNDKYVCSSLFPSSKLHRHASWLSRWSTP